MNLLPKKRYTLILLTIDSWHVHNVLNKEKVLKDERENAIKEEKTQYKRMLDSKVAVMEALKKKATNGIIKGDNQHCEYNQNDAISKHQTPTERVVAKRNEFEEKFAIGMGSVGNNQFRSKTPWYTSQTKKLIDSEKTSTILPGDPLNIIKVHTKPKELQAHLEANTNESAPVDKPTTDKLKKQDLIYEKMKSERLNREKTEKERELKLKKLNKHFF